jgi:hypothetical protein
MAKLASSPMIEVIGAKRTWLGWIARGPVLAAAVLTAAAAFGCKTGEEAPTAAATDKMQAACEVRKGWQHAIRRDCTTCLVKAAVPKCGNCSIKEYAGLCSEEDAARRAEPTCEGIEGCVYKCKDDCECLARCYEGKDACRALAGEVDECTTRACDSYCR